MTLIRPVILAGGGGTRLWPLSRDQFPKQFLSLIGTESLLQQTLSRVRGLGDLGSDEVAFGAPVLICNEQHRFLVAEQARTMQCTPHRIVLEPVGRNTAPALTCAALLDRDEDPILFVTPADHAVSNVEEFQRVIRSGARDAAADAIVTFGIVPNRPETGFGYIKCGKPLQPDAPARLIEAFVEKPALATARTYVESKDYLWNSGMFMVKASVWLQAISACRPDIVTACEAACRGGTSDNEFYRLESVAFTGCPGESIDYAVMEKITASKSMPCAVLPLDVGWSDVGSWLSLWQLLDQDPAGNVTKGDVCTIDCSDNVIISETRFVAAIGCNDLVIVETADAVMVVPKARAQDVKRVNDWLKSRHREEHVAHRRVYRPWGSYEGIDVGERFQVKRIQVKPGGKLSLQMHHHRAEHWIVVRGTAKVVRGTEEFLLSENQSTYIPLGVQHRLINPGTIPLELIEVQSGPYLGEDDIVRYEDVYNRT
jgi:mannose-1-phosphate guanylyltransferase / mannose-6-phosphate isomerase